MSPLEELPVTAGPTAVPTRCGGACEICVPRCEKYALFTQSPKAFPSNEMDAYQHQNIQYHFFSIQSHKSILKIYFSVAPHGAARRWMQILCFHVWPTRISYKDHVNLSVLITVISHVRVIKSWPKDLIILQGYLRFCSHCTRLQKAVFCQNHKSLFLVGSWMFITHKMFTI